jgi:hypothetical protein
MNRLVDSDIGKLLYQMMWRRYSQSIRTLRRGSVELQAERPRDPKDTREARAAIHAARLVEASDPGRYPRHHPWPARRCPASRR